MNYSSARIWDVYTTNKQKKSGFASPYSTTTGSLFPMELFKEATKKRSVLFLIVPGVFVIIFSLIFDIPGPGKAEIRALQLLIVTVGSALVLIGVGRMLGRQESRRDIVRSAWLGKIPNLPNIVWVVAGFAITYLFFLIFPMFFAPTHRVTYFNNYLPDYYPIGGDFRLTIDSIRSWFAQGIAQVYYPPLLTILFAPLTLIVYPVNYYIITVITLASYFLVAFLLPCLIIGKRDISIPLLIFGASAFSYGFQFELERGQFHTITMLLCISAIHLFHRRPQDRFFAYVLFSIAVQFKIYPALFVVMLVDNWRDWKANLKRFIALGSANVLLLFLLGYSYFSNFLSHMMATSGPSYEPGLENHSLTSFLTYILILGNQYLDTNKFAWLEGNINLVLELLMVYFVFCFLVVWLNAYHRNARGIDSLLMMACVLGALTLPSINHDYTLPVLTAPFALLVSEQFTQSLRGRVIVIFLLVVASFTYAITLVPFVTKPVYLQNTFPLLIILLTVTTLLSVIRNKQNTQSATRA